MNQDVVLDLTTSALELTIRIAAPILIVGLVVGVIISIFQAITQIQEQTLSFVPKLAATAAVLVIAGPWILNQLVAYTRDLWEQIPRFVG
ncbi:MAG: flagellar biosynthesis protein FliQ [Solirubrobacteraceae bacterium]|nr:flagellar biosynthesis protein FliQ [Solirubrobacteraceae bacterium]